MVDIVVITCIVLGVLILPSPNQHEDFARITKKRHPNCWK